MTMTLISHYEVGSGGAASIEFTSIPTDGTYTDLYLVLSLRTTRASTADNIRMKINASTSTYSLRTLEGNGASVSSENDTNQPSTYGISATAANATASTFSSNSVYLPNYTSSANKSYSVDAVSEHNSTTSYQRIGAGLWSTTSAITSLEFYSTSGNFVQYSSATLYGVKSGSDGITSVS